MTARPTASPGVWPYLDHRTVEQADRDDCVFCGVALAGVTTCLKRGCPRHWLVRRSGAAA